MAKHSSSFSDNREGSRRDEQNRRRTAQPVADRDQRKADRRTKVDRRGVAFGVLISTTHGAETVEDWLDGHCRGEWHLLFEGLDDKLDKKKFKVIFNEEEDKNKFIHAFSP